MSFKSKSLDSINQKLESVEPNSLRSQILQSAKNFKTSWIELGQSLYSVWKDKLYKEWGFSTFDIYASKEIGIRKQTAMKLLRSYCFLEKEEPVYLKKDYLESSDPASMPSYEAVDILRLAKNKKVLDEDEYSDLKKNVFEKGKDPRELKKDLTALIRERKELEPEEAREQRRQATLKRFVSTLKSLCHEIEASKLLPMSIVKDANRLIDAIESELE